MMLNDQRILLFFVNKIITITFFFKKENIKWEETEYIVFFSPSFYIILCVCTLLFLLFFYALHLN